MNLTNPAELKNIIGAYGFSFSKGLGQNFLIDEDVLERIVDGSGVTEEMGALEIGPGAGTLTRALAQRAARVAAVEVDKRLLPLLEYTLNDFGNTSVINADVLKLDLNELIRAEFGDMPVAVVANLPYYITTPIIMKFLEGGVPVKSLTVMIQKEVAERMTAKPGGKDYGALSAAVQFYTKPSVICRAEPHCFMPQPKVASTVVHLEVLDVPSVSVKDRDLFFKIIKSAFGQRRKTLVNALSHSPYLRADKETAAACLDALGLDAAIRGERLSLADFAALSDMLSGYKFDTKDQQKG